MLLLKDVVTRHIWCMGLARKKGILGIVLLTGPRRGVFLMSEVPMYHHASLCVVYTCTANYRGTSLIRNSPSPQDHHRNLGIVLL